MSARVGFGGLRDRAVCIDVVSGIEKKLTEEDKKDIVSIEEKIGAYCGAEEDLLPHRSHQERGVSSSLLRNAS